ncbi:hypothetical protein [Agarivorans aestuarii]|uniref:hypothetical protein n=1 Tax=Agarivorans aestuarii TaxID=1563703 RepID=UPI001C7E7FF2|nr:hypothetical protein [Agarivorans aestuarii]
MEVTIDLIICGVLFLMGVHAIYTGKTRFEFGLTNGQSGSRMEFVSSKSALLEGTRARIVGAAVAVFAILFYLSSERGEVLFVL